MAQFRSRDVRMRRRSAIVTSAHPELVSRPLPQARRGAYPAWMFRFAGCHLSGCGAHGESLSWAARLVRRTCAPAEADPEEERVALEALHSSKTAKAVLQPLKARWTGKPRERRN